MNDDLQTLPLASAIKSIDIAESEFANHIRAENKGGRDVKHTVGIPKRMDEIISESGLSLSRILQDALAGVCNKSMPLL
jgi:hypothetical protein